MNSPTPSELICPVFCFFVFFFSNLNLLFSQTPCTMDNHQYNAKNELRYILPCLVKKMINSLFTNKIQREYMYSQKELICVYAENQSERSQEKWDVQ